MKFSKKLSPEPGHEPAPLADVVITHELATRPSRPADFAAEVNALQLLARHLTALPDVIHQALVDVAVELCRAGTAGLSLLERSEEGEEVFRWRYLSGRLSAHVGGCTPRGFSPCGVCLDAGTPQLFDRPVRRFTYFAAAPAPIYEGLVVPIYEAPVAVDGGAPPAAVALGTIWIVAHEADRRFDGEDVRIMTSLAAFCAAAARSARLYHAEQEARAAMEAELRLLRASADDLRRSNSELEDFAFAASHDIQQPLRGIRHYVEFLREDLGAAMDKRARAKLDAITKLVTDSQSLIRSLLFYAQAGHGELQVAPVDSGSALREVLASLRPRLEGTPAQIKVEEPMPIVACHREFLQQIFANLIGNALRHNASERKQITIGARDGQGAPAFFVRDNGVGIARDDHERVFELFTRVPPNSGQTGGTGAGLSIVKRLIERHGGRIWIESEPGRGSTFWFTMEEASGTRH